MTNSNLTKIVPMTPELSRKFYGQDAKRTVKGVAAVNGERVLGIAGYFVYEDRLFVFSELSEELRKDKRTIVKGIRALMKLIQQTKLPVYSIQQENIEGSDVLLKHIGFVPEENGVYQWHS